jgi:sugar-specific transcriptional regulator TrmB
MARPEDLVMAFQRQVQVRARSLDEIKTYVEERSKELSELVAEAEEQIEALSKDETPRGRELRLWYIGVRKGLEFSSAFIKACGWP